MKKSSKIKILIIFVCIFIFCGGVISEMYISKYKDNYKYAINLLQQDRFEEAIKKFSELKNYKLYVIDEPIIKRYVDTAYKKLDEEKKYIKAEKLFYDGKYLDALRNYFKINDESSKYYIYAKHRINDVFLLYLNDSIKTSNENIVSNELEELLNYIKKDEEINENLYLDYIEEINKVIDSIKSEGLNAIKVKNEYSEKDFSIEDSGVGIETIVNNRNGLSRVLKIDGGYSEFDDYYIYKIPGNLVGEYKLTFSYKGYNEIIEGNIQDIQNMLQVYKLPEKPNYGDYILINLKLTINDEETNVNVVNKYDKINFDIE